jgi:hypothetical protein
VALEATHYRSEQFIALAFPFGRESASGENGGECKKVVGDDRVTRGQGLSHVPHSAEEI